MRSLHTYVVASVLWTMFILVAVIESQHIAPQGAGIAALQGTAGPTSNTGPAVPVNPYSQVKPISGNQLVQPNQFQQMTNTLTGHNALAAYTANAPYFYTDVARQQKNLNAPPIDISRSGRGIYETTHAINSPNYEGYTLGFQKGGEAFEYRNMQQHGPVGINGLVGYSTNPNNNVDYDNYDPDSAVNSPCSSVCNDVDADACPSTCDATAECYYSASKCRPIVFESGTTGKSLLYNIDQIPDFAAKLTFMAKGVANKIFTDIDTRTRVGQMEGLELKATVYFHDWFGLDFTNYRTFNGAQMVPFKLSDDIFLQVTESILPGTESIIPERNRVLIDGFMVRPMAGETVVLRGKYAALMGDNSLFMKESETLMYYQYRIVDEFGQLYQTFDFIVPYPLKTSNKGVTGWYACVFNENLGLGRDYGLHQIVNYADSEAITFTSTLLFEHIDDQSHTKPLICLIIDFMLILASYIGKPGIGIAIRGIINFLKKIKEA
mmetsp:Transcript_3129/g.4617  ORF Transcript_3129/g.4617 Transcript_3129/m.4617 type:complete len:493 (+) Transcript_3129:294-1772(+)|eukprot:CAMPEP_0117430488 /NCGR_PEP_ID=MMETSP0758-20121206/10031_1 /TAXON_ID=63605 /ORGANISM="Percolomonas cosmopolitus, Strain AE-1 (ATCC 50343)" /LENGTH=492 /DNA_ID=CAMNT_0005218565 /DNA_START=40 /DNA_END=1518 /DNA_ORIENTATION=+